jgi:hypothetical protein
MNVELEMILKDATVAEISGYPDTYLKGLRKTTIQPQSV